MIKLWVANTHSKVDYSSATDEEITLSEDILQEKFSAKDDSLKRDPLVLKGWKSDIVYFYNTKLNIIPSGLIPYLQIYYQKEKIEFETEDLRKFPVYDKDFLKQEKIVLSGLEARPYQIEAVKAIAKYRGGIIKSATGTGKSMIIAMVLRLFHKSNIIVLFDQKDLIDQTRTDLINKYGFTADDIGVIQGPNFEDDKRITLLSIFSYEKAQHLFPKIRVVMMDETHSTGRSPTAEKIIFSCQNAPIKIGLTATTEIDNPAERMRLYANVGPVIFDAGIADKIEEGYLAKIHINLYEFDTTTHMPIKGTWGDVYDRKFCNDPMWQDVLRSNGFEVIKVKRKTMAARYISDKFTEDQAISGHYMIESISDAEKIAYKNIDEHLLLPYAEALGYKLDRFEGKALFRKFVDFGDESTHYVFNDERNDFIASLAKGLKRCLILFGRREHGKELQKRIPGSIIVDGFSDQEERNLAKKLLSDDEDAVVLASGIFNKGVDIPAINNYINASGGRSTIQVIQKLGRTTRLDVKTGKTSAEVHDLFDLFSPIANSQSKKRQKIYQYLKLPITVHSV